MEDTARGVSLRRSQRYSLWVTGSYLPGELGVGDEFWIFLNIS
jgi:hypothetical protein